MSKCTCPCSVYNEKRISVEAGEGEKTEYRVWNPFRSKLAASVLAGVDNIHIKPGGKVLYLGAASGTSVSHVSDIVGPTGAVFAVEFSHRSGEHGSPPFGMCMPGWRCPLQGCAAAGPWLLCPALSMHQGPATRQGGTRTHGHVGARRYQARYTC